MAKEISADSQIAKTNAVLDRIKELKGLSGHGSESRLAEILGGMDPATLYSWRQRGTLKISVLQEFLTPEEFIYATTGERGKEVPLGTIGGSTWSQLPEQRQADAIQRAIESGRGPTKRDRWLAKQVADNALRERKLFETATPGQHYLLVTHLANGIAAGATPEDLQRGMTEILDMIEAAFRRAPG